MGSPRTLSRSSTPTLSYVSADVMWRRRPKAMRGRATPCFPRHIISKSQDSILRLVAGTPAGRDACLDETVPHHLDVRGGVSVSCGDLGVAEPSLIVRRSTPDRRSFMARECRKMCGDIGFPSKLGAADLAWAAARRTTCVAPKRVRRSPWAPMKIG